MDVNFNAPARKEGFTCAEFRSKDNQNYAFLSLPDNDALDFQATPVTTSFWVKTSNKTAANLGAINWFQTFIECFRCFYSVNI